MPEQLGITTGDIIKISKGQVKSGMDGKPIINLSGNGTMEVITDEKNKIFLPLKKLQQL